MHFVEQKFNFNKNQKELKMGILTHKLRDMNLVLQVI